jgi:hypothetical protein
MANDSQASALPSPRQWRLAKAYLILSTSLTGVMSVAAFTKASQKPHFEEIDVERLNVVEKDGTLRMTLSNAERSPGWVIRGKVIPGRPKSAGMIFFNDDGEEDGGLIFGGRKTKDGKYFAGGHLSFDQYDQDQVINLDYAEENGRRRQGLGINDQPEMPLAEMVPKFQAITKMAAGPAKDSAMKVLSVGAAKRAFIGRDYDKAAVVVLADPKDRPRLRLVVDSTGAASIVFLDAKGKVTRRISGS